MVRKLAIFLRDLLKIDEQLIRIGRENYDREQSLIAIVDTIGPSRLIGQGSKYNGEAEILTHYTDYRTPCTIDFLQPGYVQQFAMGIRTQKARDLMRQVEVSVFAITTFHDLRQLLGNRFSDQVQVELVIGHSETFNESVKRIDEIQLEVRAQ